jgi:hypothetical protein
VDVESFGESLDGFEAEFLFASFEAADLRAVIADHCSIGRSWDRFGGLSVRWWSRRGGSAGMTGARYRCGVWLALLLGLGGLLGCSNASTEAGGAPAALEIAGDSVPTGQPGFE